MKQYDASFRCARNIDWTVRLTLSRVIKFCRSSGKRMDEILPEALNEGELMDLLYVGIQDHQDAKRFDFDDFLDGNLLGDAYTRAKRAISLAIVNFILPQRNEREKVILIKAVDKVLKSEEKDATAKKKK